MTHRPYAAVGLETPKAIATSYSLVNLSLRLVNHASAQTSISNMAVIAGVELGRFEPYPNFRGNVGPDFWPLPLDQRGSLASDP